MFASRAVDTSGKDDDGDVAVVVKKGFASTTGAEADGIASLLQDPRLTRSCDSTMTSLIAGSVVMFLPECCNSESCPLGTEAEA